jgi:peptide-methionine (S)-S-oxide reductase
MKKEIAIFGGGCFWCIEAIIQRLKGVEKIDAGYTGGTAPGRPTYREVCSGKTGHAEVVQVRFDSDVLSYHDLITVFLTSHDPTLLNRQGANSGTQYRSVIYYNDEAQKQIAEEVMLELKDAFPSPIVTELSKATHFYIAELAHQNYYSQNSEAGYCRVVIDPKIAKLRAMYADKLKE